MWPGLAMCDEPESPVDPRFVLANERTLLAWLRTALAFVAIGVALAALRHLGSHARWPEVAAAASCVAGMLTAGWSYWHWRRVDVAMRSNRELPGPTIVPVLLIGIVVIAVTGLIVVVSRL